MEYSQNERFKLKDTLADYLLIVKVENRPKIFYCGKKIVNRKTLFICK